MSRLWDGGYWTSQTLKGLGPRRRIQACNIEEVAAQYRFLEKRFDETGTNKAVARDAVLALFGLVRYPGKIRVLTMPGHTWRFETALLRNRGSAKLHKAPVNDLTEIHSVENDRAVYYEELMCVPGIRNKLNTIVDLGKTSYAERALRYLWINRYLFADVDDLMREDDTVYDCAWLDYFGPLSLQRLDTIKKFFLNNVTGTLVFTNLKARWSSQVSGRLGGFESYEEWLREEFADYFIEHYIEYFDTSPMVQFAVSKAPSVAVASASCISCVDTQEALAEIAA